MTLSGIEPATFLACSEVSQLTILYVGSQILTVLNDTSVE